MSAIDQARARYRQFHGRPPKRASTVDLPMKSLDVLTYLGQALRLDYRAAKDNDTRTGGYMAEYNHEFDGEVHLACDPGGQVLVLWGPGLRVRKWLE